MKLHLIVLALITSSCLFNENNETKIDAVKIKNIGVGYNEQFDSFLFDSNYVYYGISDGQTSSAQNTRLLKCNLDFTICDTIREVDAFSKSISDINHLKLFNNEIYFLSSDDIVKVDNLSFYKINKPIVAWYHTPSFTNIVFTKNRKVILLKTYTGSNPVYMDSSNNWKSFYDTIGVLSQSSHITSSDTSIIVFSNKNIYSISDKDTIPKLLVDFPFDVYAIDIIDGIIYVGTNAGLILINNGQWKAFKTNIIFDTYSNQNHFVKIKDKIIFNHIIRHNTGPEVAIGVFDPKSQNFKTIKISENGSNFKGEYFFSIGDSLILTNGWSQLFFFKMNDIIR